MKDASNFYKQVTANMFHMNILLKDIIYTFTPNKIQIHIHKLLLIYNSNLTTNFIEVFEV